MRKSIILITIILFFHSINLWSQNFNKSQVSMDYGVARLTTGDFFGFQNHNSFKIPLNNFLSIEPGISITYGSAKSVIATPDIENANYQAKDHPGPVELGFGFGYRANEFESGFVSFNPHLDKSLYVSADIKVTAGLYSKKQMVEVSIGPSIAYIDHSYYMGSQEGVFDGITNPTEITLTQALYHRFMDYGFVVDLSYMYKITESFGLGLRLSDSRYKERDTILSSSISLSFFP